jgi:hypothetical protein
MPRRRTNPNAVAMAGEQHCSELVFKLLDALGDPVAGHTQRGCRGAETAASCDFEKNADAFPVRGRALRQNACVLSFVSTDSRIQTHRRTPHEGTF